jgi:hypothetical protein
LNVQSPASQRGVHTSDFLHRLLEILDIENLASR